VLGTVQSWTNAGVTAINHHIALPFRAIDLLPSPDIADGVVLDQYLYASSPLWRAAAGTGGQIVRAVHLGGNGFPDIGALLLQTPYSIAYLSLAQARAERLTTIALPDAHGAFVVAGLANAEAAARSLTTKRPLNMRQTLAGAPARDAYPLAGYVYLDFCSRQTGARGKALLAFARYLTGQGASHAWSNGLAALPQAVREDDRITLRRIAAASAKPLPAAHPSATTTHLPVAIVTTPPATVVPTTTVTATTVLTPLTTVTATTVLTPTTTVTATTVLTPTNMATTSPTATVVFTVAAPTLTAVPLSTTTPTATGVPSTIVTPTVAITPRP